MLWRNNGDNHETLSLPSRVPKLVTTNMECTIESHLRWSTNGRDDLP
jgi:hypothetical protein